MAETAPTSASGDRLAKVMARAGLCSRRDAEKWITEGRVKVNGKAVRTPAFNVLPSDKVEVDGAPLTARSGTRLWLYHKPAGLVVTEKDPEGRPTIFEAVEKHGLPRFLTVGRLDINTEGLLLLTNDGGLKRVLELPSTGWLRRYRVRAHGRVTQDQLDGLKNGIEVEGVKYGPIEAQLEREQGANVWITVALREGKNREIKNVLSALGLEVNRLIRTSYGPFQLGDIPVGAVTVVKARILRDQLGKKLAAEAGVDFDSPLPEDEVVDPKNAARDPNRRMKARSESAPRPRGRVVKPRRDEDKPRTAPQRKGNFEYRQRPEWEAPEAEKRVVHFEDGRTEEFEPKAKRAKSEERGDGPKRDFKDRPPRPDDRKPDRGSDRPSRDGKPSRGKPFSDRPPRGDGGKPFGDRPPRGDGDKPRGKGPRPGAARSDDRPSRADKPARGKSFGDRPPRRDGGKPVGDRPRSARPPRKDGPPRSGGPRKGPPRGRTSR